jgi:hypothetical protein
MEQPCLTYYSWELGGTEEVMLRIPKKHVLELVNPKLLDAWGSKCSASAGFLARLDAKANLRGEGARERLWKYCKENLEQGSENGYRVVHGSTPPWAGNEEHAMKLLLATGFQFRNYLFDLRRGNSVIVSTPAGKLTLERRLCEKFCNPQIVEFWRSYSGSNIPSKKWFDEDCHGVLSEEDQAEQASWLWREMLQQVDDLEDSQEGSDVGEEMKMLEALSTYRRRIHLMTYEGIEALKRQSKINGKRKRED